MSDSNNGIDLSLGLTGTHVLITGGAGLIGQIVVQHFLAAGAKVSSLDISYPFTSPAPSPNHNLLEIHADVSDQTSFTIAWNQATDAFGTVQTCIALASLDLSVLPQTDSIADYDPSTWRRILDINIGGTMMGAKLWLGGLRSHQNDTNPPSPSEGLRNVSFIIMGSEAGHFGVRTCAPYAAAKAAVQGGLLHSLRADAARIYAGARINAIAPGPVDTVRFRSETGGPGTREWWTDCVGTTALGEPVPCEAVARTALFLASEKWAGHVTGQCVNVDSGKMGAVMWLPEEKSGE